MSYASLGEIYPIEVDVPIIGKKKGTLEVPVTRIVGDIRLAAAKEIPGLVTQGANLLEAEAKKRGPDIARHAATGLIVIAVATAVGIGAAAVVWGHRISKKERR